MTQQSEKKDSPEVLLILWVNYNDSWEWNGGIQEAEEK